MEVRNSMLSVDDVDYHQWGNAELELAREYKEKGILSV